MSQTGELRDRVREHWQRETAGTRYASGERPGVYYREIAAARYRLEPYIPEFASFDEYRGKAVLEIGVGAGADFSRFVAAGALATGIDLTEAGVEHTRRHLDALGLGDHRFKLLVGDAERLPFPDGRFELVYSWGVLHHTPDTRRAFAEAARVLKPGGELKAMVYHAPSWTALMLWVRYALLRGRPWVSPRACVFRHLESPGTKAYSVGEARELAAQAGLTDIRAWTKLGPGDLLQVERSSRYRGGAYGLVWRLYPRPLVRLLGHRLGLYLLIHARRPGKIAGSPPNPEN